MNYIYDIFLNYNKDYYDFFEWNNQDLFIHYKKIPVIKVTHKTLSDILTCNIIFKENPLDKDIKSEIYTKKGIIRDDKFFIMTDAKNAIGIEINEQFKIINISSLVPEEEMEAINNVKNMNIKHIDYEVQNKKNKKIFKTRLTLEREKYIKNKLRNYYQNKNYELLDYIYYECSGNDKKNKKINDFLNNNIDTLYNLLKTINI